MNSGWPISDSLLFRSGGGKVKVQKEGHCRMCGRAVAELRALVDHPEAVRIMTRHHLVPQHWFRNNPEYQRLKGCDANIVPLCRSCHDLVELPDWKGGFEYRRELRGLLTQAEVAFVIQMRGRDWLELRYPLRYLAGRERVAELWAKAM